MLLNRRLNCSNSIDIYSPADGGLKLPETSK